MLVVWLPRLHLDDHRSIGLGVNVAQPVGGTARSPRVVIVVDDHPTARVGGARRSTKRSTSRCSVPPKRVRPASTCVAITGS
jgi:hypothetical protein